MFNNREYTKPTVGQAACSYAPLRSTYAGYSSDALVIPQMGEYVVPKFCQQGNGFPGTEYPPAYDTLSRGSGCGGYYTLQSAFPAANCSSCQGVPNAPGYNINGNQYEPFGQFATRSCASNVVSACNNPVPQVPNPSSGLMSSLFG
jgi:hypothetical protein